MKRVLFLFTIWAISCGGLLHAGDRVLSSSDALRITFSRNRNVEDVRNGSIGEKLATFEPSVKIANSSIHNFPGCRVCVMVLGENALKDNSWKILSREEFDLSIKASETFSWTGEPFEQGFDRTLAMGGYDYDGFIVLVKNSEGKVVHASATKPYWVTDLDKAWNLVKGQEYSRLQFKK